MPRPIWLNVKKRGVEKEKLPMKLKELATCLEKNELPYKNGKLHLRDKAIVCLGVLSGLRVSEMKISKGQFDFTDKKFLIIRDVSTLKRGVVREEIPCPRKGKLAPFTNILEEWLATLPTDDSQVIPSASGLGIFWNKPLSRQRIHVIVKALTGQYPHYLRMLAETHYGKIFRTNWALRDFMGLTDLRSTEPYVKTDWHDYADRMLS